jgi:hypothetical protein
VEEEGKKWKRAGSPALEDYFISHGTNSKSHVNKREFVVYSVVDDKAIRWDVHCPMLSPLR